MQNTNETLNSQFDNNESLNIREELEKYVFHWKWFFFGVVIALIGAFIYLRYSTPLYSATATIMIKDNKKAGISKELEAFKDLGIIGGSSSNNTDNEIEILKSRKLLRNVIQELGINITYITKGRVKDSEIYKTRPISLSFNDLLWARLSSTKAMASLYLPSLE